MQNDSTIKRAPLISNFHYRPEIDGLRAVAVMAVVLFHAGLGFPGGFTGVDVFFVISGYLITSILIRDLEAGKFTFSKFWERRARRIIPASVAMVLGVLIAGWFILLPSDYANLGESTIWQTFFASNFYFWRSINYFSGPADELPLLHTWSLAVEEQFYLFVPLLLAVLFRFSKLRSRRALLFLLGTGFAISLALSILIVHRRPNAAFYMLPTRAWELFAGSIVAILPAIRLSNTIRETLCLGALAAILFPYFLYTKQTTFPGLAALPSCLGTGLFIWASATPNRDGPKSMLSFQGILASRPFVFIGLLSYSLYLWHWPLFAFHSYLNDQPAPATLKITLVIASIILAWLSLRFVETPFRTGKFLITRNRVFGLSIGTGALIVICALGVFYTSGFPDRFTREGQRFAAARNDWVYTPEDDCEVEDIPDGLIKLGASSAPPHVFVWGDSHARAILPAINAACEELGYAALAATRSSTPPVLDWFRSPTYRLKELGPAYNQAVFEEIARLSEDGSVHVILAAMWSSDLSNGRVDTFTEKLTITINKLSQLDCEITLFKQVPKFPYDVPKQLALLTRFDSHLNATGVSRSDYEIQTAQQNQLFANLKKKSPNINVVDPFPSLQSNPDLVLAFSEQGSIYRDNHHLSTTGATLLTEDFIELFSRQREKAPKVTRKHTN